MKIKVIAIIITILLIVMYVPVYANSVLPEPPSDAYEYWAYFYKEGAGIRFVTSHYQITTPNDEYAGIEIIMEGGKLYKYINNEWEMLDSNCGLVYFEGYVIVASNHDIAYRDGSGFFFFSHKVHPLYQATLMTDFGMILRTFSAGLIPIIGCLILVISLQKGWEFLRTQLMH